MPEQNIDPDVPEPFAARYCGYIQRLVGRPVLVFDHGFLILDDPDPLNVGWYRRGDVPYLMHTLVNDAVLEAFIQIELATALRRPATNIVLKDFITETARAKLGVAQEPRADKVHFVMALTGELDVDYGVVGYAFPNSRYISASDPNCDPQWREQNALLVAGGFDDEGFPTQHAHVQPEGGVRVFSSGQPLDYVGYARSGTAAPTLFFRTGFLVQASRDAAAVGWYAYRHKYQAMANMDANYTQAKMRPMGARRDLWNILYDHVLERRFEEIRECLIGRRSSGDEQPCVVVDSPDTEVGTSATFFSFSGPRVRPGDKNFDATFDAAYAAQAVGPLAANGMPTTKPLVPVDEGVVIID